MLCWAISCWALAVSASASSGYSVDSALASRARIRASIRGSPAVGPGCCGPADRGRAVCPGAGPTGAIGGSRPQVRSSSRTAVASAKRSSRCRWAKAPRYSSSPGHQASASSSRSCSCQRRSRAAAEWRRFSAAIRSTARARWTGFSPRRTTRARSAGRHPADQQRPTAVSACPSSARLTAGHPPTEAASSDAPVSRARSSPSSGAVSTDRTACSSSGPASPPCCARLPTVCPCSPRRRLDGLVPPAHDAGARADARGRTAGGPRRRPASGPPPAQRSMALARISGMRSSSRVAAIRTPTTATRAPYSGPISSTGQLGPSESSAQAR